MSQLLSNEHSIITTRQHWSLVVPAVVVAGAAAIVVMLLLHFVPDTIAGNSTGTVVNGLRSVVLLVAGVTILVRYVQWRAAVYMLTDKRIVVSHGVISKVTESITLDRIQDVVVRQNLIERMIGAGSVDIESAGRDGIEVLRRISHPQTFYTSLMEAMEAHRTGGAAQAPPLPPAPPAPALPDSGV